MTFDLIYRLFQIPRRRKRVLLLVADVVLLTFSFVLAMALQVGQFDFLAAPLVWLCYALILPPTLVLFIRTGFYRAVIRYIGGQALQTIAQGVLMSALLLFGVAALFGFPIPPTVPVIYALLALLTVGGVRFAMRALMSHTQIALKKPVIIYGAGQSGRQLLVSLRHGPEYAPVALVDDARELHGVEIEGCLVYPSSALPDLVSRYGVKKLLLAFPNASKAERKQVLARLEPLPVHVLTIPDIRDIVSGKAERSELREVSLDDLLGREPVPPRPELMDANILGKTVMVTGAGGSIGSELCRQILRARPATLLLLEVSEFALYELDQELTQMAREEQLAVEIVPLLGSVQNAAWVATVFHSYAVKTVFHAAAYKHVPMVEHNVVEGVCNNVFGSQIMAQAAVAAGVDAFILISTDKAVRPTNVMGASKRMAELVCQALAREQSATRFSMVRFGNVLGSSGSVIELFRRQIMAGGPITVTHPEVNRYFMSIPEAAQLVIQAGAMAQGGDVFVLDMGKPVPIVELAQRMARLSGLKPVIEPQQDPALPLYQGSIAITFTKLRTGEKLTEELLIEDNARPTAVPRILTATDVALDWGALESIMMHLKSACDTRSIEAIRRILSQAPIGYVPEKQISDLIWQEDNKQAIATKFAAQ